ncbi:hypothetical protein BDW59DRAFT_159341 [Aspergillus cavernicola]|uniref:Histone chaperone domain-containing protein n=1 Tax=Aspergillus cavernicola TaxID=176166 RepID=A0ABR4IMM7_9EURO
MPIPIYTDKTNPSSSNPTNDQQTRATTGTNTSNHATTTSFAGDNVSTAVNGQGQPLSKEEADKLYEERMEDDEAMMDVEG